MYKVGIGVYKLPSGKFSAKIGRKDLGEFETEEQAATKYNIEAHKVFTFPVYNKRGEIPLDHDSEILITREYVHKDEINKPLKDYLKQKELEEKQKLEEKEEDSTTVDLDQVLDTLQNE